MERIIKKTGKRIGITARKLHWIYFAYRSNKGTYLNTAIHNKPDEATSFNTNQAKENSNEIKIKTESTFIVNGALENNQSKDLS